MFQASMEMKLSPSRTDRLLATRFPVLLPTIIFHNYPAKIFAQQRNFCSR